jgi:hypothetical protein
VKGQLGHSARWRKVPNRVGERVNGEAMERAATGGDRVDSLVTGARKGLTSGARLPERESGFEGARASAADRWGRADSGGGRSPGVRAEMGRMGREGGKSAACGREERRLGRIRSNQGGDFPFYFSISISPFCFEQIFSYIFLGAKKYSM